MDLVLYGPLRGVTGEKAVTVAFDGGTVAEALEAYVTAHPRARRQLFTDDGELRPSVRVHRDGEPVDPSDPCPADASLTIVPAVRGGGRATL